MFWSIMFGFCLLSNEIWGVTYIEVIRGARQLTVDVLEIIFSGDIILFVIYLFTPLITLSHLDMEWPNYKVTESSSHWYVLMLTPSYIIVHLMSQIIRSFSS